MGTILEYKNLHFKQILFLYYDKCYNYDGDINMKKGLEPIYWENSTILILGSLPGEESIKNQRYYDNKSNHFWKIVSFVFENKHIEFNNYEEKLAFLKEHNIALWDVINCANREGSLDSKIINEKYNDLKLMLNNSNIKHVFVNGRKAEKGLKKSKKIYGLDIEYKYLPSSSALNTKYSILEKVHEWKKLLI